jgi:membrane protein YqaA with SNARE-associated domain
MRNTDISVTIGTRPIFSQCESDKGVIEQKVPFEEMSGEEDSASALRARNTNKSSNQTDKDDIRKKKLIALQRRNEITLLRRPITTIKIFTHILAKCYKSLKAYFKKHRCVLLSIIIAICTAFVLNLVPGPHIPYIRAADRYVSFASWWIGLGILSSIGLGTGLHTFVLYLGPFVMKTTIAAGECMTTNFQMDGKDAFICPGDLDSQTLYPVNFWAILQKVQLAAFLWGVGTAIGELPPYFVALASRKTKLKNQQRNAELEEEDENGEKENPLMEKAKKFLENLLAKKHSFWVILAFASIPNPLFDLAGLTCGHFGISFWTFFGATFLGKAVIKAHFQTAVVIMIFYKKHLDELISFVSNHVPMLSNHLNRIIEEQKRLFHSSDQTVQTRSPIGRVWDFFLFLMIAWFVRSVIDSLVHDHLAEHDHKRLSAEKSNEDQEHHQHHR